MTDCSTLVSGQGRRDHQQHAEPSAALPRHRAGHHRGRDRPARHALRPHDQPRPRQEEEPGTTSAPRRVLTGAALHGAFSPMQRSTARSRRHSAPWRVLAGAALHRAFSRAQRCTVRSRGRSAPPRVLVVAALHRAFSPAQRSTARSRRRSAANTVHGHFIQSFHSWYTRAVIFALSPSRSKVKSKSLWLNMQRKQVSRQSVVSQPRSAVQTFNMYWKMARY